MKKKLIKVVSIVLTLVIGMTIGLAASGQLQKISAYLNYGVKIKYDGEVQNMFDANGVRVYPITYNGTTYLPVRAVANMFGEKVDWDGGKNEVLLGNNGEYIDFIEEFTPYAINGEHYKFADGKTYKFGNTEYKHYVRTFSSGAHYDLGGNYKELELDFYAKWALTVKVYGDNRVLLAEMKVNANSWNRDIKIPVVGQHQLTIETNNGENIYILDAKIK